MGAILNEERLDGVHQDLVNVVTGAAEALPFDIRITEGVRSLARQKELVAAGKSRTLKGRHLIGEDGFGHAIDICFTGSEEEIYSWERYWVLADAIRTASLRLNIPIRWGALWDTLLADVAGDPEDEVVAYRKRFKATYRRDPLVDGPHFELPESLYA